MFSEGAIYIGRGHDTSPSRARCIWINFLNEVLVHIGLSMHLSSILENNITNAQIKFREFVKFFFIDSIPSA